MKTGREKCDNAPVVKITLGDTPKRFTLIVPYYENPNFFAAQIEGWNSFPEELKRFLHLIIVDDGSPEHPAAQVLAGNPIIGINIRLFRIGVDVRWNWLAARNIGAHNAWTTWIMLTDIDHVLRADVLRSLVYGQHDTNTIYRFSRREHTGEAIHPHPNSWFMAKAMYWKIGGYDEALSGYYGTDGEYRRRCAATAPINILRDCLVRYEKLGDSSTIKYLRKQPEDARGKQIIKARKPGWKPKILSFPFQEVRLG